MKNWSQADKYHTKILSLWRIFYTVTMQQYPTKNEVKFSKNTFSDLYYHFPYS